MVSDKKIFFKFLVKKSIFSSWPRYAMDRNHLNNFERGPTKDHSCEVWSKSNQWFRRRCCLKIVDGRTDIRTTTTMTDGEWSQKLTLSFQLRWVKNRFSRRLPWRPSWISNRHDFSYFWSISHPNASYQVLSQLAFGFRSRSEKYIFKMAAMVAILDFRSARF